MQNSLCKFILFFSALGLLKLSNAYSLSAITQYFHGNASDKTYDLKGSSIKILKLANVYYSVEKIILLNPDIIYITCPMDDNERNSLFDSLKNEYAHFYQISAPSIKDNLFVASKYILDHFQRTFYTHTDLQADRCFFDFAIIQGDDLIGHCYISDVTNIINLEELLAKMNRDFDSIQTENIPFFHSENLFLGHGFKVTSSIENSLITVTKISDHEAFIAEYNKLQWAQTSDLLCWRDDDSGHFDYDVGVRKDNDGNSSASAEVGYSKENKDGSSFSVGVSAEVSRNSDGETKAEVGVSAKGRF